MGPRTTSPATAGSTPPTRSDSPARSRRSRRSNPPSWAGSGSTRPAVATVHSPTSTPGVTAPDGAGPEPGSAIKGGFVTEQLCPDCGTPRPDFTRVCPACGAPPETEQRTPTEGSEGVRAADLEPYITLRYIARLFKVL